MAEEHIKYSRKVHDRMTIGLAVYNCGYQECTPLYQWGPGVRDHYLIHYVTEGTGYYQINGTTYQIHAGDVFLVYPDREVCYWADEENPWSYAWVGFNGSDARSLLEAGGFSPDTLVQENLPGKHNILAHLRRINECYGNDLYHNTAMTGELYKTLSLFILEQKDPDLRDNSTFHDEIVQKSASYIDSHYSYPISVEDIAGAVAVSRSTLFRFFKKQLGLSPQTYLEQIRIKRACLLLMETELSIGSVARSVGYEDSMYFSKVFSKVTGQSPTRYRQEKRN